ncbi:sigma 54-interacting transcriptional regulator [candidate division KSB1 bacterium]|nr:sigma 54-interacting transcriptional regulator [candidate division KSB1 bacterium]
MLMQALLEPFAVAIENDARLRELTQLRKAAEADRRSLLNRLGREEIVDTVIGQESGLKAVIERIHLVCDSDVPVLILGETGTGKELIARMIHDRSDRTGRPFIRINCGAIPSELIDSQLFGHVKGAFTGAVTDKAGWFERADGGTLFLDEIGELPLAAQVRFLRVLQDGWFERVGGSKPIHADVRVIAATNQDLAAMVTEGRFREDLWYRIAVFPTILPPLRQRKEDISELASHFVKRAACRFKLYPVMPTEEDIQLLQSYDWPGNIREFASVIDRSAILGNGKSLEISKSMGWAGQYPRDNQETGITSTNHENVQSIESKTLDEIVRGHIEEVLVQTNGRIDGPNGAAVILEINPHTLRGRMRKLGIDWKSKRNSDSD